MTKFSIIFLYTWLFFRFILHAFDFSSDDLIDNIYYVIRSMLDCGFFYILIKSRISFLKGKKEQRLLKTLLIYSLWCLVVDLLILVGVGAYDTAIFSQVSTAILGIGAIWSIVK